MHDDLEPTESLALSATSSSADVAARLALLPTYSPLSMLDNLLPSPFDKFLLRHYTSNFSRLIPTLDDKQNPWRTVFLPLALGDPLAPTSAAEMRLQGVKDAQAVSLLGQQALRLAVLALSAVHLHHSAPRGPDNALVQQYLDQAVIQLSTAFGSICHSDRKGDTIVLAALVMLCMTEVSTKRK